MELRQRSDVVARIGEFEVTRTYYDPEQEKVGKTVCDIIEIVINSEVST